MSWFIRLAIAILLFVSSPFAALASYHFSYEALYSWSNFIGMNPVYESGDILSLLSFLIAAFLAGILVMASAVFFASLERYD